MTNYGPTWWQRLGDWWEDTGFIVFLVLALVFFLALFVWAIVGWAQAVGA